MVNENNNNFPRGSPKVYKATKASMVYFQVY